MIINVDQTITIVHSRSKAVLLVILFILLEFVLIVIANGAKLPVDNAPYEWLKILAVYFFIVLLPIAILRMLGLITFPDKYAIKISPEGLKLNNQAMVPWENIGKIELRKVSPSLFVTRDICVSLKPNTKSNFIFLGIHSRDIIISTKSLKIETKNLLDILVAYWSVSAREGLNN